MRTLLRFSLLILVSLAGQSCASDQTPAQENQTVTGRIETGKILHGIACLKDPGITYSLYLPKHYSRDRKYPVFIAFDPHGTGSLPMELYRDLAETYDYILVGSEDSRNGNNNTKTRRIIGSLLQEIPSRFSIDTVRVYTMGFSGGARVASLAALYIGGIAGVTGCGAGFPGSDMTGKFRFDYIGFAGTWDFNMYELIRLDQLLSREGFNHALFLFDGIHEWPKASIMEKAFQWNECRAMQNHLIRSDEMLVGRVKQSFDSILSRDHDKPDKIGLHRDLTNAISFLKDLTETSGYQEQLSALENSSEYKKQSGNQQKLMEKELGEQQAFAESFFSRDLTWWKERIASYDLRIRAGKSPSDVALCKRIKSYLSLIAYMNYSRSMETADQVKAGFSLQVYRIVDPENAAKIK